MKFTLTALAVLLASSHALAAAGDRPGEEHIKATADYISGALTNIVKYEDTPTSLAGYVKSIDKTDDGLYAVEVTAHFFSWAGPPQPARGTTSNSPALVCVFNKSDAKKLDLNKRITFTASAKKLSSFAERTVTYNGPRAQTVHAVVAACSL